MIPETSSSPRSIRQRPSPQQLVTRHNAVTFYAVAAASLLECAVALRSEELAGAFDADAEFRVWLEQIWHPAKAAHAHKARAYVESMWPEFDWSGAWEAFAEDYRRSARLSGLRRGMAHEALACGACAAQAAAFYRGLGAAADDPELRSLLLGMALDEAAHFERLRRCYERHRRHERVSIWISYRTVVACAHRARNLDVRLAFSRLGEDHWLRSAPFPELSYEEFVARMGSVVRRHLPLGAAQRLLFKPWLKVSDLPSAAAASDPLPCTARPSPVSRVAGGAYSR